MDEASILHEAQRGGRDGRGARAAQEVLLRQLQDVWFRFCLGMLGGDAELARDATQETALRFLRQLPGFRGESQLRTWSLSIALNVVREMRRKRNLANDDEIDLDQLAPAQFSAARGAGTIDDLERRELQTSMRSALDQLPQRQREAITLRFFEELSTEETAAAMGCATGTVKATLHQALRALRTKMTQPD